MIYLEYRLSNPLNYTLSFQWRNFLFLKVPLLQLHYSDNPQIFVQHFEEPIVARIINDRLIQIKQKLYKIYNFL